MFDKDIKEIMGFINDGKVSKENLEECIRRNIAYIAMATIMDSEYRKEVEDYVSSVEG